MEKACYHQDGSGNMGLEKQDEYSITKCKYIPYTIGSDYSGDIVTLSNYRLLKKELARYKGIYDIYGGYSTYGIAYIESEMSKAGIDKVKEIIENLEQYPAYDDEDVSILEYNLIKELFDDDYKYQDMPDKQKDLAWNIVMDGFGDYAITEQGATAYIDWDKVKELLPDAIESEKQQTKRGNRKP